MDNFDKYLEEQMQSDVLETKPSGKVLEQLRNQMLISAASSTVKQNSFLPPFTTVFGKKHRAWKISVAAVLFISFMGIKQINTKDNYMQYADSSQINTHYDTLNYQLIDSSYSY